MSQILFLSVPVIILLAVALALLVLSGTSGSMELRALAVIPAWFAIAWVVSQMDLFLAVMIGIPVFAAAGLVALTGLGFMIVLIVRAVRRLVHRDATGLVTALTAGALGVSLFLGVPWAMDVDFAVSRPYREAIARRLEAGSLRLTPGFGNYRALPPGSEWLSVGGDVLVYSGGRYVVYWDSTGVGSGSGYLYSKQGDFPEVVDDPEPQRVSDHWWRVLIE